MRRLSIPLLAVLFVATTVALAEEPARKPAKKKTAEEKAAEEEEVLTFTTEDLERKYGSPTNSSPNPAAKDKPAPKASGDEPPGPLEQLQAAQQAERDKAARREEARKRVQAAHARITELEKRQAQLRNPLLGNVQPEEGEREAWKGADQAGRIRIVESSLAVARTELDSALKELAQLR